MMPLARIALALLAAFAPLAAASAAEPDGKLTTSTHEAPPFVMIRDADGGRPVLLAGRAARLATA